MKSLIQPKPTTGSFLMTLTWLGFLTQTHALSPPPDGGYPGGNTAEGQNALFSLTTGSYNTAVGLFSLRSDAINSFNTAIGAGTLLANTANSNTAIGAGTLLSDTIGSENTATGAFALFSNTTGPGNTAMGYEALFSNAGANANAAFGAYALLSNTSGNFNTASGFGALQSNTTGVQNTATGSGALLLNTTGSYNTAAGLNALLNNTEGSSNSAFGWGALSANTIQDSNTAIGYQALFSNTAGGSTAVGSDALENSTTGIGNVAIGYQALLSNTTGSGNTAIGEEAGYQLITGSGNVYIGTAVSGVADDNNTIRIGDNLPNGPGQSACYIGGIAGQTVDPSGAGQVYVDNSGKLGVFVSSNRFKRDIKPMGEASEAILSLRPVTFYYKTDEKNTPCYGLVAEQVSEVDPDLVVRNQNGELLTVRYDQVNAMLLNEFLKDHKKLEAQQTEIQEQNAIIKQLKSMFAQEQNRVEALAERLQKVSAEIEMSTAAAPVATNRQ